jgi:hypothetical protein
VFGGFVFVVVFLAMPLAPRVGGVVVFLDASFGVFLLGQIFSDWMLPCLLWWGVFVWRV